MKKQLMLSFILFVCTSMTFAADYYVRAGAMGDGLSPTTPAGSFDAFQSSYDDAVSNTVYVAEGTYTISASDEIITPGDSKDRMFTIKGGYKANDNWLEGERVLGSTIFNGASQARSSQVFVTSSGWNQGGTTVEGVVFEDFKYANNTLFIDRDRPGFRLVDCTVRDCQAGRLFNLELDIHHTAQALGSGFTRCRFYDCTVTLDGGVVYAPRGIIFIDNSIFANITGTPGSKGSIIYTKEDLRIWLINNTIYNATGHDGIVWVRPRPDVGTKRDLEVHVVNNLICNTAAASAAQIAVDESVSDPEGHIWALNIKNNMFDIGSNVAWIDAGTLAALGYTFDQSDNLVSPGDSTDPDFTSTDTTADAAFSIGLLSDAIDMGLASYPGPIGEGVPTDDIFEKVRQSPPDIGADESGSDLLAYNPTPADGATDVDPAAAVLSWTAGSTAVTHHIYLSTTNPPEFEASQSGTSYTVPETLLKNTIYYWRIDEEESGGTIHTGEIWSFRTLGGGSRCELFSNMTPKLERGFPKNLKVPAVSEVPLPDGSTMHLDQPASSADLAAWKTAITAGDKAYISYFFLPYCTDPYHYDRYQNGPGLTGDEFSTIGSPGGYELPPDDDITHSTFTYGMIQTNVLRYVVAYRLSDDPYYIDQIFKYAEGMDWIIQNKPYLFYSIGEARDAAIANGVTVDDLPTEAFTSHAFLPHAYSGMLALQYVQDNPSYPNAAAWQAAAKTNLQTFETYMESFYGTGPNIEPYGISAEMTYHLENVPYNQIYAVYHLLNAARVGFRTLQELEGNSNYRATIDNYENILTQCFIQFKSHEDFFLIDGKTPFVSQSYTPRSDTMDRYRTHNLNKYVEDMPHAAASAWFKLLMYDFDGDEVGITDGFMTGFINCLIYQFDHPFFDGSAWQVPGRLYSPWLTDLDLIPDGTLTALSRVQDGFDGYAAFNPDYPVKLVAAGEGYDRMYLEYSRCLYQKRLERQQQARPNEAPVLDPDYTAAWDITDIRRQYVSDVPKVISYGWPRATWSIVTAPARAAIDPDSGVVNWKPVAGGPYAFTIRLANAQGQQDLSWNVEVTTVDYSIGVSAPDWNDMSYWDGTDTALDPTKTYVYRNVGDIGPALETGVDYYEFAGGSLWLDSGVLQLPSEADNTVLIHDLVFNGGDFAFPTYRKWIVKGKWTLNRDAVFFVDNNNKCVMDLVGIEGDKRLTLLGGHTTSNQLLMFNTSTTTGSYVFNGQTVPNASALEGFTGTLVLGGTFSSAHAGLLIGFDSDISAANFGVEMWQAASLHETQIKLDHNLSFRSLVIHTYNGSQWVENIVEKGVYTWSQLNSMGFGGYFTNNGGTVTIAGLDPDINGDSKVNLVDFAKVSSAWMLGGCNESNRWCDGTDFNVDGISDIYDLRILAEEWLR